MTFQQKKWGSFVAAVVLVVGFSMLTGCSNKVEEQQKQQQEAVKQMTKQGDGTVRKAGEKGHKAF